LEIVSSKKILTVFMFTLFLLPMMGGFDQNNITQNDVMIPAGHITHDPIYIDDDADFLSQAIAESWPGDGSPSSPFRIENYNIEIISGQGIRVNENVTAHYIIDNCTIYGTPLTTGVFMKGGNGTVMNCEIHSVKAGVVASNINTTIMKNLIYDFEDRGIELKNITGAKVISNTIKGYIDSSNSTLGIAIFETVNTFNLIENNTITNCISGIYSEAYSSTFINNRVSQCSFGYVEHGDGSYFMNNTVTFSTEIGIHMTSMAENNNIYYNYILNNTLNAEDDGISNQWDDDEVLGNYWNEGFSAVYEIPGDANAMDRYPFYIESIPPVLEDITEVTLTLGSALTTIVWDAVDLTPNQFWVYVNDLLFLSGEWNNDTIAVDFSSLTEGDYSVTMIIQDRNGFSASDQMILHMIVERVGGLDMLLVVGGVAVILVVIVVIVYLKKR